MYTENSTNKMKPTVSIVTLLLLYTCCSQAIASTCVVGTPPFRITPRNNRLGGPARDILFVPMYKFACYGKVTQWGVFMKQHETALDAFVAYNIDFQVWRPERDGIQVLDCYHFIGSNYFPGFHTESSGRFLGDVPEGKRIDVQPFDIIAVAASDRIQINNADSSEVLWATLTPMTVTTSTRVCLETEIPGSLTIVVTFKPLLQAIVDTTNTSQDPRSIDTSTNLPTVPTISLPSTTVTVTTGTLPLTTVPTDTPPLTTVTTGTPPLTTVNSDTPPLTTVTSDTPPSTMTNPVTTNTDSVSTEEATSNTPLTRDLSTTSPSSTNELVNSGLGTEGVIGISASIIGLLLLALIVLIIIVLVVFMSRKKLTNQQVGVPQTPHIKITRKTDIEQTASNKNEGKNDLYTQKNLAYNTQSFPATQEHGYETIPVSVPEHYMQVQCRQEN